MGSLAARNQNCPRFCDLSQNKMGLDGGSFLNHIKLDFHNHLYLSFFCCPLPKMPRIFVTFCQNKMGLDGGSFLNHIKLDFHNHLYLSFFCCPLPKMPRIFVTFCQNKMGLAGGYIYSRKFDFIILISL